MAFACRCWAPAAALFLLLCLPPVAADWPTFHLDAKRSGVPAETWARHELSVAWSTELDPESVDASAAVVAGRVYVGTATGKVVCVRAADGQPVWETKTGGCVLSSPAVAEGRVFVGSADRCLYALNADTGAVLWRCRTRRPVVSPPLCLDGRVYFGSGDGVLRCLDAGTGRLCWEAKEQGEISGGAAAAEGRLYYGDEAGNVVCRQAADGQLAWSSKVAGGVVAAPTVAGDRLVVPVMSATALSPPPTPCITVLDATSGQQIWTVVKGSSVMHTPVTDGQRVYFATVSGYLSDTELFACSLTDGTELWKRRLGGVADSSPLLAGQYLMFGNHDRNFYVVDSADGSVAQALPLGAKLFASPALVDGSLYIGAQDGKLYCLR